MMTRIDTIPQEATDLAVHVALCEQRHAEAMKLLDEARGEIMRLRADLRRVGIYVVIASGAVSAAPHMALFVSLVLRAIGL